MSVKKKIDKFERKERLNNIRPFLLVGTFSAIFIGFHLYLNQGEREHEVVSGTVLKIVPEQGYDSLDYLIQIELDSGNVIALYETYPSGLLIGEHVKVRVSKIERSGFTEYRRLLKNDT